MSEPDSPPPSEADGPPEPRSDSDTDSELRSNHGSGPSSVPRGVPFYLLAALLLLATVLSVPHHVQAGDAGEFATIMLEGGVPHPSGYPWMRLLGLPARALRALGMKPASAAAYPCALLGVAAWLTLWPLLARWAGRGPATVAIAVAATASPVLVHVPDSEVWGPHLFACAVVLRVAASSTPRPWLIGLCFGLAVSHHLSAVLMLPVVVGAVWPRPFEFRRLTRIAIQGIAAGVVGLLPYVTLAIGRGGAWRWGHTETLDGLVRHVLRMDYGTFQLSLHKEDPEVLDQWGRALQTIGDALTGGWTTGPWAALLALLLIAGLAARRTSLAPAQTSASASSRLSPGLAWGLAGSVLACTLAFPAAHNIDPNNPFGAWILERFDLLSILLWCPLWAMAAGVLWERAGSLAIRAALGLAAALLLTTQVVRSVAAGVPATDAGVERYARDLLRTPEPDRLALVIGTDDHRVFPVLFAQQVLGEGAHVLYIDASLLSQRWYRDQLRQRWPALPEIDKPVALIGALWSDPAHADMPIFLANVFSRPAKTVPVVPQGLLWRALPPHARDVTAQQVAQAHIAAFERYGPPPTGGHGSAHPWTDDLHAAYNEGTGRLLAALQAEGRTADVRTVLDALGPWRPPTR